MKFELGQCSGPCAGKISEPDYREQVADFLRFLAQEPSNAVEGLIAKREAYTEALLFEKAAVVQERLSQLEQLQFTSHRLIQAVERQHCLIVLPDKEPGMLRLLSVLQGQPSQWKTIEPQRLDWGDLERWIQVELDRVETLESLPQQAIPKVMYEESRLISQWLANRSESEGAVVGLVGKSAKAVLNELLLVISPEFVHHFDQEDDLDAAEEAWAWEQEQQA
jgi:excinuclease UvrABC nuclease subunit